MTTDTEKAARALEMIKAELSGRPNVNTLRTFLLLAEYGSGHLRDLGSVLKASSATVARAVKFWTAKNFVADDPQLRDLRLRRVRITWERRSFHNRLKEAMETGTIPPPDPEPVETDDEPEIEDPWLKEYLQSDEFKELERKDGEKRKREEARQREWQAKLEERTRNPKTAIDAYRNWMETCPHPSGSKKRKEWKRTTRWCQMP